MPNKNYKKGYGFEKLIQKRFEDKGFFCMRSSGSHTPIDLAAHKQRLHIFMQLKKSDKLIDLHNLFSQIEVRNFLNLPIEDSLLVKRFIVVQDLMGIRTYEYNPSRKGWQEVLYLQELEILK